MAERAAIAGGEAPRRKPFPGREPDMHRLLLTPEEAAETIGVSRSKIYELLRRGAIPSVKIGALRRVPLSALEQYVESLSII